MNNTIYNEAKKAIKQTAKQLKATSNDVPYIQQSLNDLCDQFCRKFNYYALTDKITEKQAALYAVWLSSFTADMHP